MATLFSRLSTRLHNIKAIIPESGDWSVALFCSPADRLASSYKMAFCRRLADAALNNRLAREWRPEGRNWHGTSIRFQCGRSHLEVRVHRWGVLSHNLDRAAVHFLFRAPVLLKRET